MSVSGAATPAMQQYLAAKQQHPEALLFFRMGDFYELFFEDAKTAARTLGITLTSRNKGEDAVPMAGVPVRSLDTYLKRLVQAGHRVAICEQVQDPRDAKGIVERRVVRIVTPGTLTEDSLLEERRANHLAAIVASKGHAGLSWVDLSTGTFRTTECRIARLADELARIEASEILLPEGSRDDGLHLAVTDATSAATTTRPAHEFGYETARKVLQDFFSVATLDSFGVTDLRLGVGAAGALIGYLKETQLSALPHLQKLEQHHRDQVMALDRATRQSLELVETMREARGGSPLLQVLDRTRTPMGARLLREWVLAPRTDLPTILSRQQAVAELYERGTMADQLASALTGVLDLQRLTARISTGRCNARDLIALRMSLLQVPLLRDALQDAGADTLQFHRDGLDPLQSLEQAIGAAIVDEPPLTIREGGMIRQGYHAELDELFTIGRDSRDWMARFQAQEIARTGIQNLKVSFNRVFGYYIEITHGNRDVPVPADYVRKQTTKNSERYITDELKRFETKVLRSEELAQELEYDLFCRLREQVADAIPLILQTAAHMAGIDTLLCLATVARDRSWHRPTVDDSRVLWIEGGRHPVLESTHVAGSFVPNDTDLDPPLRQLALITGPNMAGKSTYIRQNALIVLLAQIGSFVPAAAARIGLVDRIFTRVGAADDISRGASTFMVEMTETANILHNASARSLVILDEVGRGTSTFDGLSLAFAIAEDLHDRIGCRTLFATHYHQMTDLADTCRGVVNLRVAVREWNDEIVFLHRIENGGTDKSYGLHVARLAGLPKAVLNRARVVLAELEQDEDQIREVLRTRPTRQGQQQMALFESPRERVLRDLASIDVDQMTPLQAMQKLAEWVATLKT